MVVKGIIEHIIFHNQENGYTVLVVDAGGEMITASGSFPSPAEGMCVTLEGDYKNTKYGMQFVAETVEISEPDDEDSIFRYLSSGLIKGVGDVTAERIVSMFGKDTLDVIEHHPDRLRMVKGISARKAVEIANNFTEIKSMQKSVMFLQKLGLTTGLSMRIYEAYGDRSQEAVTANPYRMIEDVDGVGFLTADKIAAKLGVRADSGFRVRAVLVYLLKENSASGSTYLPLAELNARVKYLLGESENEVLVQNAIEELIVDGVVCRKTRADETCVALTAFYRMEKSIASRLLALSASYREQPVNAEAEIAAYERVHAITLHAKQREAIASAVDSGVAVVTGGPGTGKTTIVNGILTILKSRGMRVELVAPTGRAAKRLSETTGEEAKTIHRLLDLDFKNGKGYFTYNENTRLDCDAVIVDEVSMVDAYVMSSLLKAVRDGSKLILVGDKDQLPSVGAGNILADVIASKLFPVCALTEIYRQGKESMIVLNAHRINHGEMPVLNSANSDFFFDAKADADEILQTTLELVTRRVPGFSGAAPERIQVLCPMKKGVCGSIAINAELQKLLNPAQKDKAECSVDQTIFRVGDKVMQTANNYQLEWTRGLGESGVGVFNGDIGAIREIHAGSGEMSVEFEDGRVSSYTAADVPDLALAYAISIHKSQGSEFDIVVIPLVRGHRALFTRNLLYTAVTRAKRMVVICGSREAVRAMVDNDYTEKRYSLLADFLTETGPDVSSLQHLE